MYVASQISWSIRNVFQKEMSDKCQNSGDFCLFWQWVIRFWQRRPAPDPYSHWQPWIWGLLAHLRRPKVLLKMLVVMDAHQQWVKYGRYVVAGRHTAISPLLALLLALMSPSLECKVACHLSLRQSASSCVWHRSWWETLWRRPITMPWSYRRRKSHREEGPPDRRERSNKTVCLTIIAKWWQWISQTW